MRTGTATGVMVHHDAGADTGGPLVNGATGSRHNAARLVSGDNRAAHLAEPERSSPTGGAIELQVAAAHAGCLDLDHDIVRSRCWIGKFHELQFAFAEESHAPHGLLPGVRGASQRNTIRRTHHTSQCSGAEIPSMWRSISGLAQHRLCNPIISS